MSLGRMAVAAFLLTALCAAGCAVGISPEEIDSTSNALGETGLIRGLATKCLDVQWASTAPGTPVWLYTCSGRDRNGVLIACQ